jgi:hypothetical protein
MFICVALQLEAACTPDICKREFFWNCIYTSWHSLRVSPCRGLSKTRLSDRRRKFGSIILQFLGPKMSFCPSCGGPIEQQIPEGEHELRAVCTLCHRIHYQNPKMVGFDAFPHELATTQFSALKILWRISCCSNLEEFLGYLFLEKYVIDTIVFCW